MAKDDYHVIVYQILSYLYVQLKSGEDADPAKLSADGPLFRINEKYWQYIFLNLLKDGYIEGFIAERKQSITGERIVIDYLNHCQITPKGIDYLTDNSLLRKAAELASNAASIAPWMDILTR